VGAEENCLEGVSDGLVQRWFGRGLVFVNPPFSNLKEWAEKALKEASQGAEVVFVCPANVSHSAWRSLWQAQAVCFPSKRVRYWSNGKPGPAPPFGSAICYFGESPILFTKIFQTLGPVVGRL